MQLPGNRARPAPIHPSIYLSIYLPPASLAFTAFSYGDAPTAHPPPPIPTCFLLLRGRAHCPPASPLRSRPAAPPAAHLCPPRPAPLPRRAGGAPRRAPLRAHPAPVPSYPPARRGPSLPPRRRPVPSFPRAEGRPGPPGAASPPRAAQGGSQSARRCRAELFTQSQPAPRRGAGSGGRAGSGGSAAAPAGTRRRRTRIRAGRGTKRGGAAGADDSLARGLLARPPASPRRGHPALLPDHDPAPVPAGPPRRFPLRGPAPFRPPPLPAFYAYSLLRLPPLPGAPPK